MIKYVARNLFIRANLVVTTFLFAIVANRIVFAGVVCIVLMSMAGVLLIRGANSADPSAILKPPQSPTIAHAQDKTESKQLRLLFLGNSHTSFHNVPGLVKQMVESVGSHQVDIQTFGGAFLDNLAANRTVKESIADGKWDFVIMQGQKISMSGKFIYSTEGAKSLSNLAKKSGAKVIWFSEWGRRDVAGESERTQKIYEEIAATNNDLIAPIGKVWDSVLEARPKLALHAADGNHANATGAYLTALTLSGLITSSDCRQLPNIELDGINDELQLFLKSSVDAETKKRVIEKQAN